MNGGVVMGFFDAVMGRRKPVQPNLDALFRLPAAALTLEAAMDLRPNGRAAVAFRAPQGVAFADVQADVTALVEAGSQGLSPEGDRGSRVAVSADDFGFTWLQLRRDPGDVPGLVTDLHAVNVTLKDSGFGSTLLCSVLGMEDSRGRQVALVYLFKQGTFYPFVPLPGQRARDNVTELQIRDLVGVELPLEPDVRRWFALWGAPGMDL